MPDLIYTENKLYIAKERKNWRFWQDYFTDYQTSIEFSNLENLYDFLREEYRLDEKIMAEISQKIAHSNEFYTEIVLKASP